MALNIRQIEHAVRAQQAAMYGMLLDNLCYGIVEANNEEFNNVSHINDIVSADLVARYGFDKDALNAFIGQFATKFMNYYRNTSGTVETNDLGKKARAIISHNLLQ